LAIFILFLLFDDMIKIIKIRISLVFDHNRFSLDSVELFPILICHSQRESVASC